MSEDQRWVVLWSMSGPDRGNDGGAMFLTHEEAEAQIDEIKKVGNALRWYVLIRGEIVRVG